METIGEKIKRIRKSKGISQMTVADICGIKQSSYANIESGKTQNITIEIGRGIADALGLSFNELFEIEVPFDYASEESKKDVEKLLEMLKAGSNRISELEKRIEEKEAHIDLLVKGQYALQFVIMSYVSQHPNIESRKNMFDNLIQLKVLTKESIENFQTMNKSMGDFISNFKKYTE